MFIIDIIQKATDTEQIQSVVIDMAKLESWATKIIAVEASVIVALVGAIVFIFKMLQGQWKNWSEQQTKMQVDTNKIIIDNTNALNSVKDGIESIPGHIEKIMELIDLRKKNGNDKV